MNKRSKNMLVFILSTSMILANMIPVFAEEVEDNYEAIDSIEETAVLSSEDMAELDWVDIGYPDGNYSGLPNPFAVVNDSEKGINHTFSKLLNDPKSDSNILLVSFTNGYNENLALTAVNNKAKDLRVYNEGSVTASDNDPFHIINLQGYDGHGETYYINSNMFGLTEDEVNNLTLGEKIPCEEPHAGYYEWNVTSGLWIEDRGYHSYNAETGEEFAKPHLTVSMDIVKDHYNPLDDTDNSEQTWIRISFVGATYDKEGSEVVDSEVIPEWQKDGFKREFLNDNGDYIETVSSSEFVSKKVKPIVTLSYNGQTYTSGKGGKLVVSYKNNKNAGQATITLKKVKKDKSLTRIIKGKTITFEIAPITVSDNNIQVKTKNGTVKSVKVMTGNKMKKVSKKMWKVVGSGVEGSEIVFSGNYKGSVSVNSL